MYYLIEPTDSFAESLADYPSDSVIQFLRKPMLFMRGEGGKTIWAPVDYIALAKLQFITYLIMEFSPFPEFSERLGNVPISVEEFDRRWTIERYGIEENLEAAMEVLKEDRNLLSRVEPTGLANVDYYLKALTERLDGES